MRREPVFPSSTPPDVVLLLEQCDAIGPDRCGRLGFLALDGALGEYAVMTGLAAIDFRSPADPTDWERAQTLAQFRAAMGVTGP